MLPMFFFVLFENIALAVFWGGCVFIFFETLNNVKSEGYIQMCGSRSQT